MLYGMGRDLFSVLFCSDLRDLCSDPMVRGCLQCSACP